METARSFCECNNACALDNIRHPAIDLHSYGTHPDMIGAQLLWPRPGTGRKKKISKCNRSQWNDLQIFSISEIWALRLFSVTVQKALINYTPLADDQTPPWVPKQPYLIWNPDNSSSAANSTSMTNLFNMLAKSSKILKVLAVAKKRTIYN